MKGIIPGMGALMTWINIPGTGVHFFLGWLLSLVQEAILVVIPTGGHLGYYPSMGGQISYY